MTALEQPGQPQPSRATVDSASASTERKLGKCTPERMPYLHTLLRLYKPPKNRLKGKMRELNLQIHSLLQGFDGVKAVCFKCERIIETAYAEVHHINGNESDNSIDNTAPIDGKCNRELNGAKGGKINAERSAALRQQYSNVAALPQREGEHPSAAQAYTARDESQGAPELVKHDAMRPRYDRWVRDLVNGPFATQYSWPRDLLAEKAPYACSIKFGEAFGSSKTYLKFIKEDAGFGLLNTEIREGVEIITLNKEMLKKIQEQTGQ